MDKELILNNDRWRPFSPNELVDVLTYRSWLAQVELYGMSFESARKLYQNAKSYEKIYLEGKAK